MKEQHQIIIKEREIEKENKRKKRIEMQNAKKSQNKKLKKEKYNSCDICLLDILTSAVSCSQCKKTYHESCIPKNYRNNIPDEEDIDLFLCQQCYKEETEDEGNEEFEDDNDVEELLKEYKEFYKNN